ncbi:MAG: hypothetical protein KAQ93_01565, partial [Spirochaetales bacterium]|nr:hypothetical protein [Spirochaetales bacterium]
MIRTKMEKYNHMDSINNIVRLMEQPKPFKTVLSEILNQISDTVGQFEGASIKLVLDDEEYKSRQFKETDCFDKLLLRFPENKDNTLVVFYKNKIDEYSDSGFFSENHNFLLVAENLLTGFISRYKLGKLYCENNERLKELRSINKTSEILKKNYSLEESLQNICMILPEAWQYPDSTVARIKYRDKVFISREFQDTEWLQCQIFESPGNIKGTIEIFYLREFPEESEGPFLKEERDLLTNLSRLISGSADYDILISLIGENNERLKELGAINRTSRLISEYNPIDETLNEITGILKQSWQYPEYTEVNIYFQGKEYMTPGYKETIWSQKENFVTIDNKKGTIYVVYLKEFPDVYEGPFLKEERNLLVNIGKLISGYLNNSKGREIYRRNVYKKHGIEKQEDYKKSLITNKGPLQLFFNQQVLDKYIYLDMMKYKVKEILFVATLYDAFILGNEDGFFERFMGEIYQYSLFSLPRITGVTTEEDALDMLETKAFDLVIIMVSLDTELPITLSKKIKQKNSSLPVYLLLNQKSKLKYFEELVSSSTTLDNLFFWNGDSQIIFAIVKSIEDKANVANDTQVGLVRVILLVEDSSQYYSRYLQILYAIVFEQVQQLLPEVEKNELDKIGKMRSRPKILLARNYEDAMSLFNQYKDFILCVISDIEFEHQGRSDKSAGIKFIKYVKSHLLKIPIILQSSDNKNKKKADDLDVIFINKNSKMLLGELKKHLNYYLGFGDFIFRDKMGNQIAVARTLMDFEKQLKEISDETFFLHANENQYSIWLMARGEIKLAKTINPLKIDSIKNVPVFRQKLLESIKYHQEEKKRGRIFRFEESPIMDEKNITTLSNGSLGGKGRGLAFINTLIYNYDFSSISSMINIRTPITVIIGTEEFDTFIHSNQLYEMSMGGKNDFSIIKQKFLSGSLSPALENKLKLFLKQVTKPIAIRSSSLSEDSFTQPFAGVFHTYILPNSSEKKDLIFIKLKQAIKLVFASIFSEEAKEYFVAVNHRVEDEKMAVVLQELVGQRYGDYYYPHISGTASSYNYYPVAHMKPEEGFAMAALGLGTYVVNGMTSYRFSPKYPNVDMYTTKDMINCSQVNFYAVDCRKNDIDYATDGELASLVLLEISEAEKHGSLKHCVSVYDRQNDRLLPDLSAYGPRILNFANILKYDFIPLAR